MPPSIILLSAADPHGLVSLQLQVQWCTLLPWIFFFVSSCHGVYDLSVVPAEDFSQRWHNMLLQSYLKQVVHVSKVCVLRITSTWEMYWQCLCSEWGTSRVSGMSKILAFPCERHLSLSFLCTHVLCLTSCGTQSSAVPTLLLFFVMLLRTWLGPWWTPVCQWWWPATVNKFKLSWQP